MKTRDLRHCPTHTLRSPSPLALLMAVLALTVGPLSPSPATAGTDRRSYLVRFTDGVDPHREAASLGPLTPRVRRVFENVFNGAQIELTDAEASDLRSDPRVAAVEPDQPVSAAATQTNPTWGLDRIDQRPVPLSGTYSYPDEGGAGVTAYVIDTGIRSDHVDFAGRVAPGMTVFNDGRGTEDCNGHGTHVAGTLGGSRYGVAKAVTLVPVRILNCHGGGAASGIIAALEWIVGHHVPGTPAVVNMSFGNFNFSAVRGPIVEAFQAGLSIVVAAGNSAIDACGVVPNSLQTIIVGASDSTDTVADFSNQGPCVDVFAPGVGITSAFPSSSTDTRTFSGTSGAAPHVAGAVAVLRGQNPLLSPWDVQQAIVAAATPGVLKNVNADTPNRLLYSPPPPPANNDFAQAAVFEANGTNTLRGYNVGATKQGGEPAHAGVPATSSVWWKVNPPKDGTMKLNTAGSTFDTVLGLYTGDSVTALSQVGANDDASGNPWSEVTATVTKGTTYHVAVDGRGGDSGDIVLLYSFTLPPAPVPGAPTITEVAPGKASATVKWKPPTGSGSSITSYWVRAYTGSKLIQTASAGPGTTTVVGGLQNGTTYTFTVATATSGGPGAESASSEPVTPRTVPDAPSDVQVSGSDGGAVLTWTPPGSDGGAPIESYTVTVFADGTRVRSEVFLPATTAVIGNLANGTTYTFTVEATNAAGRGPASVPSAPVIPSEPVPEAQPPIPPPPAVNQAPVAAPDAYHVTGGSSLSVTAASGVLANDQDSDGDVLTAVVTAAPVHGTIVMDRLGGFTYTPASGWIGSDTVDYQARDGLGGLSTATVTLETTAVPTSLGGYWMLSDSGKVYTFGNAQSFGDGASGATDLEPALDGKGYWILNADGEVSNFGAAPNLDGQPALRSGETAASLSVTPSGNGYWIFTSAGRVFSYGDAQHYGDMSGTVLNGPVLDSVATPSGLGYWMVASDGGIFSFGDAKFFGSMGANGLNQPVISMAPDPDGTGYWLVASDGGIFAFEASFYGSMGSVALNRPVSGMVPGPAGYLMVAEDGGIFAFGDVPFHGSLGSSPPPRPVVAVALAR